MGFRKCGTTTLYDMLSSHPEIDTNPNYKESQIYNLPPEHFKQQFNKQIETYFQNKYFLDAPTLSLFSDNTIPNIKSLQYDVKIIFILRKPEERFRSAYYHMRRKNGKFENREEKTINKTYANSIRNKEPIDKAEKNSLEKAQLNSEIHIGEELYEKLNKRLDFPLKKTFNDEFVQFAYQKESNYSSYLKVWKKEFKENIFVLSIEQLRKNKTNTVNRLSDFLELRLDENQDLPKSNITLNTNSKLANFLSPIYRTLSINKLVAGNRYLSKALLDFKKLIMGTKVHSNALDMDILKKLFDEEYDYWRLNYPEIYEYWNSNS